MSAATPPNSSSLPHAPRHKTVAARAATVVVRGRPVEAGQHGLHQELGPAYRPARHSARGFGDADGQAVGAQHDDRVRLVGDRQGSGTTRDCRRCAPQLETVQGQRQLLFGDGEALGACGRGVEQRECDLVLEME